MPMARLCGSSFVGAGNRAAGPDCLPQAQLIGYALSHHVPDMRRGFDILTSHGRWHVDAKPAAQMAELMRQHLMQQLETI
jgi:hypothetical protein